MTPRFLDFSGKLQPYEDLFSEIIRATSEQDTPFFVVGAFARDIIMMAHGIAIKRATEDIDCGIQVKSWAQFEQLKASLINTQQFKPDEKQQQRIKYRDLVEVDIVPFGTIEKDAAITWPNEGTVMITLGFDEAYKDTIAVRLVENEEIRICSLAGLALMKLIAWNDRRARYRKDAEDLGFIMSNYLDAGNSDRILGEEAEQGDLLTADFDYCLAGARLLGRDVGQLLTARSYAPIMKILDDQTGERNQYPLVEAMLSNFQWEFEKGLSLLESLKQGILDIRKRLGM
jgi:predicted nucleotidyltransferase